MEYWLLLFDTTDDLRRCNCRLLQVLLDLATNCMCHMASAVKLHGSLHSSCSWMALTRMSVAVHNHSQHSWMHLLVWTPAERGR